MQDAEFLGLERVCRLVISYGGSLRIPVTGLCFPFSLFRFVTLSMDYPYNKEKAIGWSYLHGNTGILRARRLSTTERIKWPRC